VEIGWLQPKAVSWRKADLGPSRKNYLHRAIIDTQIREPKEILAFGQKIVNRPSTNLNSLLNTHFVPANFFNQISLEP